MAKAQSLSISLIFVGIMIVIVIGFVFYMFGPGSSPEVQQIESEKYWEKADIAFEEIVIGTSFSYLRINTNLRAAADITDISIGGLSINTVPALPETIRPGTAKLLNTTTLRCAIPGEPFSQLVLVSYIDTATGEDKVFEGKSPLTTFCKQN